MTIRARLTALYFVVLAASFSVFVWISDVGFQRSIDVTVNNASSVNLQSLQQLLALNAPKGTAKVQKELAELASWWPNGVLFEVADENHNWLYQPRQFLQASVPLPPLRDGQITFFTTNLNQLQYRVAMRQVAAGGRTFEIHAAVPTEPFDLALDNFRAIERERCRC